RARERGLAARARHALLAARAPRAGAGRGARARGRAADPALTPVGLPGLRRAELRPRPRGGDRVRGTGGPLSDLLVVDLPQAEQPFAVHFDELVLVVSERRDLRRALRVRVAHVEPVCGAARAVAVDVEDDVRDVVTSGRGPQARGIGRALLLRRRAQVRDHLANRLAALDFSGAVVEDAVLGERRRVGVRVAEVEREEIPRLKVLDHRAVLGVAAVGERAGGGERDAGDDGTAAESVESCTHGRSPVMDRRARAVVTGA